MDTERTENITEGLSERYRQNYKNKMSIYSGSFGHNQGSYTNSLNEELRRHKRTKAIHKSEYFDSGKKLVEFLKFLFLSFNIIYSIGFLMLFDLAKFAKVSEQQLECPPKPLPYALAYECQICSKQFTCLIHKHKCRNCKLFICNSCSPYREYVPGHRDKRVRVCFI